MTPERQRVAIFVAAGVMAVLGMAAVGAFIWKSVHMLQHPAPVSAEERKLLVTADALRTFGAPPAGKRGETMKTIRQLDGTKDVEYTYSSKRDPEAKIPLYILSKVQVLPMSLTALQVFKMEQMAIRAGVGLASGNTTLRPRPDLLTCGDQQYAAMIEHDGKPMGNLFIIRQGRVVHTVTLTGFYFEKTEAADALFAAPLAEAKRKYP